MSTTITCDWCTFEIDDREEYTAEELNRLGFEEGLDQGRHVVIESRFGGHDRYGHVEKRSEVRHFHHPKCYLAALKLWDDHADWAEAQGGGPKAAMAPKWSGEDLTEPPTRQKVAPPSRLKTFRGGSPVVPESGFRPGRLPRPPLTDKEAFARWREHMERREACGTRIRYLTSLGHETAYALWHGGFATVEDLATCTRDDLLSISKIGPKRAANIADVMAEKGFSLRSL